MDIERVSTAYSRIIVCFKWPPSELSQLFVDDEPMDGLFYFEKLADEYIKLIKKQGGVSL